MNKKSLFLCSILLSTAAVSLTAPSSSSAMKTAHQFGFQINVLDAAGKTQLDYAVESNNFKFARQLVKHGGKVTTQENAVILKSKYKSRAAKFFITGLIFTPFLWIGTYFALSDASDIMVLKA